jgi:hypothetical protein
LTTTEVEREDAYRAQQRDAIIAGIDMADTRNWRETLLRCAETDATDGATLPPFLTFLRGLGEARPHMVLGFIRDDNPVWERFLPDMFKGVESGGLAAELQELVGTWIDAGTHLGAVVRYLESANPFDADKLVRATRKAMAVADDRALLFAVSAINTRHRSVPGGLWPIFAEAIRHLIANEYYRWTQFVWARTKEESIFYGLSEADAAVALDALRSLPDLDYRSESVLATIAADWPLLVIDYLADRVRRSRDLDLREFEPLPRGFHVLQKVLPKEMEHLLSVSSELYKEDPASFRFRGVLLVSNVFPKFTPELNEPLLALARKGSDEDLHFLANLLGKYKSDAAIYGLCKEIIARTEDQDVRTDVKMAMTTFGVVGGEYGFADAYQRVRDGVQQWLKDERGPVREFAKAYLHQLEQTIASERRSAQLQAEQRKRA